MSTKKNVNLVSISITELQEKRLAVQKARLKNVLFIVQ
jgi:hypothetical protein